MMLRKDKHKDKYDTIDHPKTWYYWYTYCFSAAIMTISNKWVE